MNGPCSFPEVCHHTGLRHPTWEDEQDKTDISVPFLLNYIELENRYSCQKNRLMVENSNKNIHVALFVFCRKKIFKRNLSYSLFFRFKEVKKLKSAPAEAPLCHRKHCSWNTLWLCDITLCHHVTYLHKSRLGARGVFQMEGGYSSTAHEPENEHDISPLILKKWNGDKSQQRS